MLRKPARRIAAAWPWAGLAAAGLVGVSVFVVAQGGLAPQRSGEQVLSVPMGQTRTLALQGGSAVVEGGSKLTFSKKADAERIDLYTGGASFQLKHDPARRFTVVAGGQQVTDLGTIFDANLIAGSLTVTVAEGEVEVRPVTGDGAPLRVAANRALVRRAGDTTSRVVAKDLSPLRRVYEGRSLSSVAADLNQFYSRPIRLEGAGVTTFRFTGVLVLDSEEAVVRRLEAYLPIKARYTPGAITLAAR